MLFQPQPHQLSTKHPRYRHSRVPRARLNPDPPYASAIGHPTPLIYTNRNTNPAPDPAHSIPVPHTQRTVAQSQTRQWPPPPKDPRLLSSHAS
ncbi:hypothetical protein BDW74DRAFT_147922 [Aspergillus multicolor]|uniref:uncharacterized protein n=1 Tax=Aspergillus multicolor TaxID=41759 RepID=UPI003CCDF4EE